MTALQTRTVPARTSPPRPPETRRGRPVGSWLLPLYVTVAFLILLIPIAYTFAFSFNAANRSNISWNGFTLENWLTVCSQPDVCVAFGNSLLVGAVATLIATTLGTLTGTVAASS